MPWDPQPRSDDQMVRRQYYAGYSDAYHGYRFGSGEEDPSSDYSRGYGEALAHTNPLRAPLPSPRPTGRDARMGRG